MLWTKYYMFAIITMYIIQCKPYNTLCVGNALKKYSLKINYSKGHLQGRFGLFFNNYWYYSVITKCCPNLLHHVSSLVWNQSYPKIWQVWNHSERSNLNLCKLFGLISQKRCVLCITNPSMKHIHKVIYHLAVYIKTFDLGHVR